MTPGEACLALAHIVEPADPDVGAQVERMGPVAVLERIGQGRLAVSNGAVLRERARRFDADAARAAAERIGARIIARDEPAWPTQLDDLGPSRPFALWTLGEADLRLGLIRSLAVVGTREATSYGMQVTRQWCSTFVEHRMAVVSGGAFGIDASAHRAVLDCEGLTICVLASGVDVSYPRSHEALIARIADEGLVVSESPIGEAPRRHRFITRNRIIAALTRATLIVEAAARSGTTTTARHAAGIGRPIFAVPGPVTSPTSAGCHGLITAGAAHLVDEPTVVIEAVCGPQDGARVCSQSPLPLDCLDDTQARVLDAMPTRGSLGPTEIALRSAVPVREVIRAVGHLAALGLLVAGPDGWRRPPRA